MEPMMTEVVVHLSTKSEEEKEKNAYHRLRNTYDKKGHTDHDKVKNALLENSQHPLRQYIFSWYLLKSCEKLLNSSALPYSDEIVTTVRKFCAEAFVIGFPSVNRRDENFSLIPLQQCQLDLPSEFTAFTTTMRTSLGKLNLQLKDIAQEIEEFTVAFPTLRCA